MADTQGVAAAGRDAGHILPLECLGQGGAESWIYVAVSESAEYAQLAVDVAMVFIPRDGADAHSFGACVGGLSVDFYLIGHVIEIWRAGAANGIPQRGVGDGVGVVECRGRARAYDAPVGAAEHTPAVGVGDPGFKFGSDRPFAGVGDIGQHSYHGVVAVGRQCAVICAPLVMG